MKVSRLIIPTSLTVSGIGLISSTDKDKLIGRESLYHGTTEKAKESILKEGLKKEHALDSDNLTNSVLKNLGIKDGRGLVYITKKKSSAKRISEISEKRGRGNGSVLEISIPYSDYKNDIEKFRIYENPEFSNEGIYTKEDYVNKILNDVKNKKINSNYSLNKIKRKSEKYWDDFSGGKGTPGTRIFEKDIDPKYIKESKSYQPLTVEEFKEYVKDNPGRFGKEAIKLGSGLMLSGIGIKKLVKK